MLGDRLEHRRRARLLDASRWPRRSAAGTAKRRAEAEGEGDRRAGQGDVAGLHADQMLRRNVSHGASTSRWNWTQPLGTPVVPLVKAISAGSSRPVSTGGSGSSDAVRVSSSPLP